MNVRERTAFDGVRLAIAVLLCSISVVSIAFEIEAVFPSSLLLAFLFFLRSKRIGTELKTRDSLWPGYTARVAVTWYCIFWAVLSLLLSFFLEPIAVLFGLTGMFAGDFVRVTINDGHEFCYGAMLLLLIEAVTLLILRLRRTA